MSQGEDLARVDSFQYPAGHLSHLSESQSKALESFKKLCEEKGYYKPAGPGGSPSHDDETMLRYLRARKFVPQDAWGQFKETEDWRKENKIDSLYNTIDLDHYEETRRLYPQWTGRRDKRGIPVYVFHVSGLTSKRMSEYDASIAKAQKSSPSQISPKLMRLFALYENLTRFVMPFCSAIPGRPFPETPVSQSNNIVDISGVGLKQFWNLKGHMQDASQLATAHYPETLDRIFIIGAPSFFPTVWSWIKRWFDPITVSKIFILSTQDMKKTLQEYIEPQNIPERYGGTLKWDVGQPPSLDPEIQKAVKWEQPNTVSGENTIPCGPIKWVRSKDGADMQAVAVGTTAGKQREDNVLAIPGGYKRSPLDSIETPKSSLAAPPALTRSTTGEHTHPNDYTDAFPRSGNTPPPEYDESLRSPASSSQDLPIRSAPAVATTIGAPTTESGRQGTSVTRAAQQSRTHAHGNVAAGTPLTVDSGTGDKTTTMEPKTIGQAPKAVEVPEAQSESQEDSSYLDQAKSAAGAAAGAVSSAGAGLLAAAGLGENTEKPAEKPAQPKAEDPRIDNLGKEHVEDFIRGNYTTSNDMGSRPVDQVQRDTKNE